MLDFVDGLSKLRLCVHFLNFAYMSTEHYLKLLNDTAAGFGACQAML